MPLQAFKSLLDPEYLSRIEPFSLMARTAVEGYLSGLHRSVLQGFGSEFLQYRHYTPGEDLKYVDWKLYARRDRLHTKVFQEETHMNVYLILDCSASMGYRGSQALNTKLRYASMIAACLAYLACRQGDNVSLIAYSDKVCNYIEPGHRNQQLQRILLALAKAEAKGSGNHDAGLSFLESHIANRGLVIFMSDMLEGETHLPKHLGRLRLRHCDCIALQILDPDERLLPRRESARFEDLEKVCKRGHSVYCDILTPGNAQRIRQIPAKT